MAAITGLLNISEEWLQYAVRLNLSGERKEDLAGLRKRVLKNGKIKSYLSDIANFHGTLVRNHKNPGLPIHKLLFLLDIGLDRSVPEINAAIGKILERKDSNGVYQSLTNIPEHFGGSGEDVFAWCLCDAPLLLFALNEAGADYERHIKTGLDYLVSFHRDNGFLCAAASELGKFRGPGRKDDCCPYATLVMLRLLLGVPEYRESRITEACAGSLLSLWENSMERHPYMFYMGTDFRKLKAPSIWFDIVSVAEVLSKCGGVKKDRRFLDMLSLIRSKQGADGLFTPEAVYLKCKDWDFGQKKSVSPYLTYLCMKIFRQAET